jgi:hypothetical protein
MAGKVKVQPVSSAGLAPLVEMAEQLRIALPGWSDAQRSVPRPRFDSDLAHDLGHLARHDGDGFLIASLGDEVVGFAAGHVRSRHLLLPQVWLLPEHVGEPVAETLVRRAVAFGERSGAQDAAALVLGGAEHQLQLLRFGLRPRFPVYRLVLPAESARRLGIDLASAMPGREVSGDPAGRRAAGGADLERLDRLVRGVSRPMDHEYWLAERGLRLALVREKQRISAYAYGGPGQCGPVVASTGEAALAALGWALQLAAASADLLVDLLVPAPFEAAIEHLLDAGARGRAVGQWMTRQPPLAADRWIPGGATLL